MVSQQTGVTAARVVAYGCVGGVKQLPPLHAGESVERSYTPVDTLEAARQRNGLLPPSGQEGETIELMVKLYKDGKMSGFLSNLKEGRYIAARFRVPLYEKLDL